MFGFLLRKDVRKILKRKDSDAGERGRALEEIGASMFSIILMNKLGAFFSSARICGAATALVGMSLSRRQQSTLEI